MSAVTVDGSASVRKRPTTRVGDFLARRRSLVGTVSGLALLLVAEPRPTMMAAGLALMLVAYSLRVLCAGCIEKNETLAARGPYAWCRNPLYVANLLAVLAFGLMSGLWLALPAVLAIWLATHLPAVAREERFLRERFGAQFEQYCARTPRWWPRRPRSAEAIATDRSVNGEAAPVGQRSCATPGFSWRRVLANGEHLNILSALLVAAMFFVEMVR